MLSSQHKSSWLKKLFEQKPIAPLAIFRVCFGFLLSFHCVYFIASGSLYTYFVKPTFVLTAEGFTFLQGMHGDMMYAFFIVLALLGLLIMFGLFYRFAMIAATVLWQLAYLVQEANYNNHYYFILLLCYILCFVPAHRFFSLDVQWRKIKERSTCEQWIYVLFIAQVAIVYFFAGISKLNAGWLSGSFYRTMHVFKTPYPFIGSLYFNPVYKYMIIWGGLLFDLFICPLLLIKRTRIYAFILACIFHLFNAYWFAIGTFPYLSIALLIFFFDPGFIAKKFFPNKQFVPDKNDVVVKKRVVYLLAVYLLIQLLLPIRAIFFKDNVYWTEKGYKLSWRMMMRTKGGDIHFTVKDSSINKIWSNQEQWLTEEQQKTVAIKPYLIWQYAQWLKKDFDKKGYKDVQVYASSQVKLNSTIAQPMIDSTIDLSKATLHYFGNDDWVLPYKK